MGARAIEDLYPSELNQDQLNQHQFNQDGVSKLGVLYEIFQILSPQDLDLINLQQSDPQNQSLSQLLVNYLNIEQAAAETSNKTSANSFSPLKLVKAPEKVPKKVKDQHNLKLPYSDIVLPHYKMDEKMEQEARGEVDRLQFLLKFRETFQNLGKEQGKLLIISSYKELRHKKLFSKFHKQAKMKGTLINREC